MSVSAHIEASAVLLCMPTNFTHPHGAHGEHLPALCMQTVRWRQDETQARM